MKKINLDSEKVLAIIAIIVSLSATVMEGLVLLKILPYDIIGGGRMESYEKAAALAVFSIIMQLFLVYCIAVASNIFYNHKFQKIAVTVLRVFVVYFAINIVMNLFGTTLLEKVYGSISCLVQIVCFTLIIRSRKQEYCG